MTPLALSNGAGGVRHPAYSNAAGGGADRVRQCGANPHGKRVNAAGGFRHPLFVTLPTVGGAYVVAPHRRRRSGGAVERLGKGGRRTMTPTEGDSMISTATPAGAAA